MNINEAELLANRLIQEHVPSYRFRWGKSVGRIGCCYLNLKVIEISKPLAEINSQEIITDTILHEIAHALVGKGHGHDTCWKKACRKIGANPVREVECKAIYKYRAFCPHCNDYHYRNKLVKRPLWCIKSKGFLPDEQLFWEEGQFVE